ncbi:hypothetical protein EDB84DRAFT_1533663 [Lactarius hengduanensis]|nr:hypothetical protein EDB84DRAFT_1533663 [Lactarius hengduanensis]
MVVVCSGAVAAVVRAVAVRGTLDLEERKKSRAEAESAAQDTLTIARSNQRLQHQLLSHPSPLATSHRLHGRHHAGTQPTTTPLPCYRAAVAASAS